MLAHSSLGRILANRCDNDFHVLSHHHENDGMSVDIRQNLPEQPNCADFDAFTFFQLFFFFVCRDFDGAIVRPLPRAKRMLSEATCLPHIVQVC